MQSAEARILRDDEDLRNRPTRRFERPHAQRRTITITGQVVPPRRRSATQQQLEARPDRVALWAFLLGIFLVLVAAATANAAPL
jgi:hypothetical protein